MLREPDPTSAATDDELDLVAQELAEMVRNCMRAAASMSPTPPTHRATHHLVTFSEGLSKQPGIEPFRLVSRAVEFLHSERPGDHRLYLIREAARMGTQLFLELSAADGFAGGRVSQRRQAFDDAMKSLEAERLTVALAAVGGHQSSV